MTKEVHLYASQRVSRRAKDGIDGTSVTIISKSVTYQISASGTETPTGNWSDKVVAATDTKPYLWTRTIVVYSDTNSTTSYSVSYKGKDGAPGKDAYRVEASPSTLVFDTNENGVVDGSALSGKYATVTVYKGSQKISADNLSLPSNYATKKYTNVDGRIYNTNGEARITITEIEQETISGDEKVSKSSGQISFPIDVFGERSTLMWVTVNVQVNVAKFTGSVVANNKKFETQFTEISDRFKNTPTNTDLTNAESRITQTAREISLSVSEKSVGRRNMLVGSAFNRQEGFGLHLGPNVRGYGILMNDGVDGMNCIKVASYYDGTEYQYCGAFWSGDYTKNIRIKHGTQYTFSCWVKVLDANTTVYLEVIYNRAEIGQDRDGRPTGNWSFAIKEPNKWQLVKWSFITDDTHDWIEANVFTSSDVAYKTFVARFCKPMLEEGDYNGWSLSQDDYDYIGGNMLDNARTLDKSGTLIDTNDTVIQNGYGTDSACIKNLMKANATPSDYKEVLRWSFGSTYLVNGNDYIFSFVAKADVDDARVVCYMWSGDIENSCNIFTEGNGGAWDSKDDGNIVFILSRQWTRYWVHWRPKDGYATPKEVIIRHTGNNSTSASTVYVTQPKLEIGATMTEWTERKTDLVDKASLKAAGIEITSEKVKLYGDQIEFAQTKSGTAFAMFKDGMLDARLINAAKIIAERLETSGNAGQRVAIEDGLMQIFGTNGVCNIKFGVNDNGEAILSYYDKNGKWLYDLGPNKLDGSQITSSSVTIKEYVKATIKPGTNDFYDNVTYLGKEVKQVKFQYSQLLFGNNRFMNEDDEIKKNSSAHIGYQPFANESNVTKLYRYSAPRMGNTIVKDDKYGLSTADLAKRADGKYFTSMTMASGGSLVNLAPVGVYFGKNEAVRYASYPNASVGSTNDRFPAFTIGGLEISKAGVGSSIGAYNGFYSYLTRKVTNLNTDIIS